MHELHLDTREVNSGLKQVMTTISGVCSTFQNKGIEKILEVLQQMILTIDAIRGDKKYT